MLCCARNDLRASPTELGCRTASRSTGGPHPINNVPLRCHVIYSNTFRCDTPGGLPRDTDLPFLKTCYQKVETQKFRFARYFGRFFFGGLFSFPVFGKAGESRGKISVRGWRLHWQFSKYLKFSKYFSITAPPSSRRSEEKRNGKKRNGKMSPRPFET